MVKGICTNYFTALVFQTLSSIYVAQLPQRPADTTWVEPPHAPAEEYYGSSISTQSSHAWLLCKYKKQDEVANYKNHHSRRVTKQSLHSSPLQCQEKGADNEDGKAHPQRICQRLTLQLALTSMIVAWKQWEILRMCYDLWMLCIKQIFIMKQNHGLNSRT